MKQVSTALANLIASAQFVQGAPGPAAGFFVPFDLYTIVTSAGEILLYTTADFPITAPNSTIWNAPNIDGSGTLWFAGMTWQPAAFDMKQTKATGHWKVGLDSDTWQVKFAPKPPGQNGVNPDLIGSIPWLEAAAGGILDNADCIVSRAYFAAMPSWDPTSAAWIGPNGAVPVGTLVMFRGYLGEVDLELTSAILTINDYKQLMQQQMPRNLYGASCKHVFGDSRCTINLATYTKNGFVASFSGGTLNSTSAIPSPGGSGTYKFGVMTITSGKNSGLKQFIMTWNGTTAFGLIKPFPYAFNGGETFTVSAGCDHTQATCQLFTPPSPGPLTGNLANFKGESYVPTPEIQLG